MSEVFEGYERQYCELSANLSRKCSSTSLLSDQGAFKILILLWLNPPFCRLPLFSVLRFSILKCPCCVLALIGTERIIGCISGSRVCVLGNGFSQS